MTTTAGAQVASLVMVMSAWVYTLIQNNIQTKNAFKTKANSYHRPVMDRNVQEEPWVMVSVHV